MASNLRIVVNPKGVDQLLKSPEVLGDLERRGRAIAAAADGNTGRPGDHRVESEIGSKRARVAVITDTFNAMHREADQRTLSRALDAGRA